MLSDLIDWALPVLTRNGRFSLFLAPTGYYKLLRVQVSEGLRGLEPNARVRASDHDDLVRQV